jgi:hypothetical protein
MRQFKSWLFIGLVVCLSLLPIGCGNGESNSTKVALPPPPTKTFSSTEIYNSMASIGILTEKAVISDGLYVLAKREWVEKEFSSGLSAFQFQFGINNWNAESNDCDKFSGAASFYLRWLNHSSPNRNVKAALAAGEVYYRTDQGQNHAINLFILEKDGVLTPSFYEPQTRRFVTLSQSEIFSVFFWKL